MQNRNVTKNLTKYTGNGKKVIIVSFLFFLPLELLGRYFRFKSDGFTKTSN